MFSFQPSDYGATVAQLLDSDRVQVLGPGKPNEVMRPALAKLSPDDVVPATTSRELAGCCLSGLWLWHNFLEESHEISQNLHSAEGSYWHGIMHRREPDYSNAKYWFRRVGDHAIFPALLEAGQALASRKQADPKASSAGNLSRSAQELVEAAHWDPYGFVDLCQSAARDGGDDESFCRQMATIEWQLLFDYCYQAAR